MPIVVTWPGSGDPFGPGFTVQVHSDFVGAAPNLNWEVILEAADNEGGAYTASWLVADASSDLIRNYMLPDEGEFWLPFPLVGVNDGEAGVLHITLRQGISALETIDVPVTIDMTTGLPGLLSQQVRRQGAGAALTAEQSLQLESAAANTVKTWPGPIGDIVEGVANLITHPPLGLLASSFTVGPFSGSGEVPVPEEVSFVFGLYWRFTAIPPNLGRSTVGLQFFNQTMVQLRARYTVGTTIGGPTLELYNEVLQANWDQVIWMFKEPLPTAIEFDTLPGVEVEFQWVCLRHAA